MKNKPLLLSLFMLAAMAVGQKAWAQSLYVGGVSVNLNATTTQTITGDGISGKVTYNPGTKTLYLEDAVIHGSIYGMQLGSSATDRYFIYLKGANSLITSNRAIRFDDSYVVLYGASGASMTVNSSASADYSCIGVERSHFEVWAIKLSLTGSSKGFYGTPSSSSLEFINSIVDVECEAAAVYGFKSVSYNDCSCTDEGMTFKSGKGCLDRDGVLATWFHVRPYLMVGDEPVRTGVDSKTGALYPWKWTKSTKTLEITGNLYTTSNTGISNFAIDGLTITTSGNYAVASSNIGIIFRKNTNFAGSGTLTVMSSTSNGIVARGDMSVCMGGLNVYGKVHGLIDEMRAHKLTLKKYDDGSDYRFAGATRACLCMSNLEMNDMDIYTGNTWWNPSDGYAYYNNDIFWSSSTSSADGCVCFKSKSQIQYIGLYIGETNIRENCMHHIVSPAVTSGSVAYDADSKTLTLTDVTLTNTDGMIGGGIDNRNISELTVKLVGDNIINARTNALHSLQDFSIIGDGTLTATATQGDGLFMSGNYITCSIDGPRVELTGAYAVNDDRGKATLDVTGQTTFVTLNTNSPDHETVHNLGRLMLRYYQAIHEPLGAYYDKSLKSITTDGTTPYKGKVVIYQKEIYGMYIGEKEVSSANAPDILGNGQFKYDASTKTLTVTNATFENRGTFGTAIRNDEIDGLNIVFVGDNTFTVRNEPISSHKSLTITGDGKLTGISSDGGGLILNGRSPVTPIVCTIDGPQLDFTCYRKGLYGYCTTLNVTGSTTRLTFTPRDYVDYVAVQDLSNLTLGSGISIIEPKGGYFDASLGSITTDGTNLYKGKVVIGKNVDFAATPADPQIIDFTLTGSYPNMNFNIPTEDAAGNALQTSKLFYTVWIETEGVRKPFVVRASEYRDVTEDMVEIPYNYNDGFDIYEGGSLFYINPTDEPAYCTKIGVQSIYYGGGECHKSNIVWIDNPAFDPTGIRSIDNGQLTMDQLIYNLNGQRLAKTQRGINIINGRKIQVK